MEKLNFIDVENLPILYVQITNLKPVSTISVKESTLVIDTQVERVFGSFKKNLKNSQCPWKHGIAWVCSQRSRT